MLRVENLKVGSLPPLSFEVADGECLAVEAPSGTGKTRLLRALADLDHADGLVLVDGASRDEVPAPLWRKVVRYVSAEPGWWTDTPRPALASASADPVRLDRLMRSLGLEPALLDRATTALSTGERQRLALVRALADEPKVLLLDEPCAALDSASAALVEELIRFQVLSGRIVVLVSHDKAQVDRLAHARLELAAPSPTGSASRDEGPAAGGAGQVEPWILNTEPRP